MEKSKRRSKKDNQNREYTCTCGKNYLSYPALYTHVKTKHEQMKPDVVVKKKIRNCNDVFEVFLNIKGGELKYKSFIELLKNCLNERGYQMDCENPDAEYCAAKKPANIPNIANYFLIQYLPFTSPEYDIGEATDLIEEFCQWLHSKKHTKYVIERINS
jgi:hypothetical protein